VTDSILYEKSGHIAFITFNRPEHANAFTLDMRNRLIEIWTDVREDPEIRCAIVTGAGRRHFSTGTDVASVAETGRVNAGNGPASLELKWSARQNQVWKPTICAVNGIAAGSGLHFVVDSDIVVAADHAEFLDAHVNVGMVGGAENVGLARRLPLGTALRMTLQGKAYRLPARRAYQLGLVDELTPSAELMDAAQAIANDIAKNSPRAVSLSQQAVWSALELPYEKAVEFGWSLVRLQWSHPDFVEGPRAYAEKREPRWTTT
jgi:enoyl-CoA hydratase/carnithine racemase